MKTSYICNFLQEPETYLTYASTQKHAAITCRTTNFFFPVVYYTKLDSFSPLNSVHYMHLVVSTSICINTLCVEPESQNFITTQVIERDKRLKLSLL